MALLRVFVLTLLLPSICFANEAKCLAWAMHAEARGESHKGMELVGHVILNRAQKQGKSVCDVIRQRGQFSFYKKGATPKFDENSMAIALMLLEQHRKGTRRDLSLGSVYFVHRKVYTRVKWKHVLVMRYKNHLFLREG